MITNLKEKDPKAGLNLFAGFLLILLLVVGVYVSTDKGFSRFCFWGNNVKYFVLKLKNPNSINESKFHRNNAIYLAKMYLQTDIALQEFDLAIESLPKTAPEHNLSILYKERGELNLFLGNKDSALRDFFIARDVLGPDDLFKVAMLFKERKQYKEAMSYCLNLSQFNNKQYDFWACKSEIYNSLNRADVSLSVWDTAISVNENNAFFYIERARVKKALDDIEGYEADVKTAQKISSVIDINYSRANNILNPKKLRLDIDKS